MPIELVSIDFCCSFKCGEPNRIDFPLDNLDADGVVAFEPLLIVFEFGTVCSVCCSSALLWRRFTSTKIGSSAFRNSFTASSCAKLLTSFPFT